METPLFVSRDEKSQRLIGFLEMPEFFSHIPWGQHIDIVSRCTN